jgi:hypothetical protein
LVRFSPIRETYSLEVPTAAREGTASSSSDALMLASVGIAEHELSISRTSNLSSHIHTTDVAETGSFGALATLTSMMARCVTLASR